jgi:addiction module HigA family antidote
MTTKHRATHTHAIHPGEILSEEFLAPHNLSQYRLAKEIHVPPRRINEIVHGTRGMSADTALRLSYFFGTTPQFWMNLQNHYDLATSTARNSDALEASIQPFVA